MNKIFHQILIHFKALSLDEAETQCFLQEVVREIRFAMQKFMVPFVVKACDMLSHLSSQCQICNFCYQVTVFQKWISGSLIWCKKPILDYNGSSYFF